MQIQSADNAIKIARNMWVADVASSNFELAKPPAALAAHKS